MDYSFLDDEIKQIKERGYQPYQSEGRCDEYDFVGREWSDIRRYIRDGCEETNKRYGKEALKFDDRNIDRADFKIVSVNRDMLVWFDRYTPAVVYDFRGKKHLFKVAAGHHPTFVEAMNEPITSEEIAKQILRAATQDVRMI